MGKGNAQIEITASSARLSAGLAEARAKFTGWSGSLSRQIGAAFKSIKTPGQVTTQALGHAGGDLIGKGITAVTEAAEGVRDFERDLTRLQIATRKQPADMDAMRDSINAVSSETGIARSEILAGARSFVDLAGASAYSEKVLRLIARTSQATGAAMNDVGTTIYSLGDAMKIDPKDMEATLSGLINQSKDGAVHFNQMAEEIIGIAPQFARFGVIGKQGALQFGAMFQVMRSGFKGPAETATGMTGIFKGLRLHADKFAKAGIQIYDVHKDGTKTLKPLLGILDAIGKSKLAKDPTALQKAFGRGEGEQAFQMFTKHLALYNQLIEAGEKENVIQEDMGAFAESNAGKIDLAMNNLKLAIAEAFTPERIAAFTNAVMELAGRLEPIVASVGKIGDAFGALYGAGKSIRGALSGNENANPESPRQKEKDEAFLDLAKSDRGRQFLNMSPLELKGQRVAATLRLANAAAYDKAVDDITGGEKDERSTPESIKRAYLATRGDQSTPGSIGANAAGSKYLTAAGVSPEKAAAAYGKETVETFNDGNTKLIAEVAKLAAVNKVATDFLEVIAKASGDAPTVQIGDNQVAKSVKRAPQVRRSPHP